MMQLNSELQSPWSLTLTVILIALFSTNNISRAKIADNVKEARERESVGGARASAD